MSPRRVRAGAVCSVSGCPEDATNEGRCPTHQRKRPKRTVSVSGWEEQRRAKRVIARDHGQCYVCGLLGADQADHVLALSAGGADDESNMAPIHSRPCHAEKSERERLAAIKARAQR